MQIREKGNNSFHILLSPKERLCLSGVLNEVRHGFRVPNFDQQIGLSREEASQLHSILKNESSLEKPEVELTVRQLSGLRNALTEALGELGTEEFDTRVGMSFEDAQQLGLQIKRALGMAQSRHGCHGQPT
jgi:hypothetical protein